MMTDLSLAGRIIKSLKSWEGFLFLMLILLFIANSMISPFFFTVNNQINLFQLSIEKIIVATIMTFVIINAEIDLSVASIMGFSACLFGWLFQHGVPAELAIFIVLGAGAVLGALTPSGLPGLVFPPSLSPWRP